MSKCRNGCRGGELGARAPGTHSFCCQAFGFARKFALRWRRRTKRLEASQKTWIGDGRVGITPRYHGGKNGGRGHRGRAAGGCSDSGSDRGCEEAATFDLPPHRARARSTGTEHQGRWLGTRVSSSRSGMKLTKRLFESQAVMKIVKHAREAALSATSASAAGQLLGLDSAGVLNVSDVFPLPSGSLSGGSDGDESRGSKSGALDRPSRRTTRADFFDQRRGTPLPSCPDFQPSAQTPTLWASTCRRRTVNTSRRPDFWRL